MNVNYRIGEAAELSGLSTPTIRFYEARGLLPPPNRSDSGYRQYDGRAIRQLRLIRHARALGLPLEEVHALIRGSHTNSCDGYVTQLQGMIARQQAEVASKIAELQRLEAELHQIANQVATIEFDGSEPSNPESCACCPLLDEPSDSDSYCNPGGTPAMLKNSIATADLLEVLSCDLGKRPAGAPTEADLAPFYLGHELLEGTLRVCYATEASPMLTEFAAAETRCCSGLVWAVQPVDERVELRISGTLPQLEALAAMWSSRETSL